MQVKDIMFKQVIAVRRSTKLKELLKLFSKFHIFPLVPVIEDDNKLAGVVSFKNLMNVFKPYNPDILKNVPFLDEEKDDDIFSMELTEEMGSLVIVEDIMQTKFISIKQDSSLQEAFNLMKLNLKEEFPVIDNEGKLIGIIGVFDIVRHVFHQKGVI
ncbi:MAG: CBS domain-containing protein [Candidatus Omnitrophica bacterium]|nr:CBS domain-containing protein [Candidatus Omnitrophota bacterium]